MPTIRNSPFRWHENPTRKMLCGPAGYVCCRMRSASITRRTTPLSGTRAFGLYFDRRKLLLVLKSGQTSVSTTPRHRPFEMGRKRCCAVPVRVWLSTGLPVNPGQECLLLLHLCARFPTISTCTNRWTVITQLDDRRFGIIEVRSAAPGKQSDLWRIIIRSCRPTLDAPYNSSAVANPNNGKMPVISRSISGRQRSHAQRYRHTQPRRVDIATTTKAGYFEISGRRRQLGACVAEFGRGAGGCKPRL